MTTVRSYFVVTRGRGNGWDPSRERREQEQWDEHAAFMEVLVEEGFVVLGGPVGDGLNVLLVIAAESENEIQARLAEDPWAPLEILGPVRVERWEVLLAGAGYA